LAETLKRSKLASCVALTHWAMPSGLNLTTTAFVATSLTVLSGLFSQSGMTGTTTLHVAEVQGAACPPRGHRDAAE
jgi:hypothetical protein